MIGDQFQTTVTSTRNLIIYRQKILDHIYFLQVSWNLKHFLFLMHNTNNNLVSHLRFDYLTTHKPKVCDCTIQLAHVLSNITNNYSHLNKLFLMFISLHVIIMCPQVLLLTPSSAFGVSMCCSRFPAGKKLPNERFSNEWYVAHSKHSHNRR